MPVIFLLLAFLIPSAVSAAVSDCALLVYTPRGQVAIDRHEEVLLLHGELSIIAWIGEGAARAYNREGTLVPTLGAELVAPSRDTTYTYRFEDAGSEEECSVRFRVVNIAINQESLTASEEEPTVTGTASRIRSFRLTAENTEGHRIASKNVRVRSGRWEAELASSLDPGRYTIEISGERDIKLNTIVSATMTVQGESSGVPLGVSGVALLTGGRAAPGSAIPVAYVKVENLGRAEASISGFYLKENGSAPDSVVIGFETSDDLGGSRERTGEVGFRNGVAFVALRARLEAGEVRIYTIKALISEMSGRYAGNQLKIDTIGIDKGAGMVPLRPIEGAVWVLSG